MCTSIKMRKVVHRQGGKECWRERDGESGNSRRRMQIVCQGRPIWNDCTDNSGAARNEVWDRGREGGEIPRTIWDKKEKRLKSLRGNFKVRKSQVKKSIRKKLKPRTKLEHAETGGSLIFRRREGKGDGHRPRRKKPSYELKARIMSGTEESICRRVKGTLT